MRSFGFEQGTQDWRRVMDDPDIDIVIIAAPNMLHVELIEAACAARKRYHGRFVPGNANPIGYEDLVVIEDYEFCRAVAEDRPFTPGFEDAVEIVSAQAALLRSVESGRWEDVVSLRED